MVRTYDSVPVGGYSREIKRTLPGWYDTVAGQFEFVTEAKPLPVSLVNTEFNLDGDVNMDVSAFKDIAGAQADAFVYEDAANVGAITPTFLGIAGYESGATSMRALSADASGNLNVNVVSIPVSITEYDEDSGHTTGDKGIQMLAVRNDNNTSLVDTDLDYAPLAVNSTGGLIGAGYDETENFTWSKEKNPISQHHQTSELAAVTAQTNGTYEYTSTMDDYRNFAIHIQNTSGGEGSNVYTVEASMDGSNYIDVTDQWFGVTDVTDNNAWLEMDSVCAANSIKVKDVRSGDDDTPAPDGGWTINIKRLY